MLYNKNIKQLKKIFSTVKFEIGLTTLNINSVPFLALWHKTFNILVKNKSNKK